MSWRYEPLSSHYDVHNGLSKASEYFGSGFPFLAFKDVFHNAFLPEKLNGKVETTERERESYSIKKGDVFLTRTSETYDELGMSSVALKDYPNATYNGFTKRLRPKTDSLLPRFVGYYMRSPEFRANFLQFSQMTTRASLKNENLLAIKIPVPPKETQKSISDTLSSYDKLIENNHKQIKLLEESAQRLYKEWFIDLRFPGRESTAMNPETGLPEGWRRASLGKYAEFRRGKIITAKQTRPGSVPVVAGGLEPAYFHDTSNASAPVITISGSGANAGYTRLYNEDIWASDCSYIDSTNCENIFFVFETVLLLGNGFRHLQRGSAQPHVYPKNINELVMVLPSEVILSSYEQTASKLFDQIRTLDEQCKIAKEARNRLLSKLMSEELRTWQ